MEAAFVSIGEEKNGVLYVADVSNSKRNSKIENLLKQVQEILVQVVKDAMGEKGARLTGQISFPGRYLVLIPNSIFTFLPIISWFFIEVRSIFPKFCSIENSLGLDGPIGGMGLGTISSSSSSI